MPRLSLAERFLLARRRAKLTQPAMAKLMRVSKLTIVRLEKGMVMSKRTRMTTRAALDRLLLVEQRQREEKRRRKVKKETDNQCQP